VLASGGDPADAPAPRDAEQELPTWGELAATRAPRDAEQELPTPGLGEREWIRPPRRSPNYMQTHEQDLR
jgi:hypothetical protein